MLDPRIIWSVVTEPALLVLLGLTLVLAWPIGSRLARPRVLGVLFVVVLGSLLAATVTTGAGRSAVAVQLGPIQSYLGQLFDPGLLCSDLRGFGQTGERLANIGLYLPLGFLATLIWRRPGWSIAGGAALSFAIELWQAVIGRGGDLNDVLHNSAGTALGALLVSTYLATQGTV